MNYDYVWRYGANFTPSSAINQLEMWQADTFDPATIDRELGFAEKIGMTLMRVYLHDLAYEQDKDGFLARLEQYLSISERHGIRTMPVFFDDCWRSRFAAGKQPEPTPFEHNSGWIQSPGNQAADDLTQRPRLEAYVKAVLERFSKDSRILLWDLYNEPGNGESGDNSSKSGMRANASMPLLRDIFRWAREVKPSQPITSGPWLYNEEFAELSKFQNENSDIVSFHCYFGPERTREVIREMRVIADGRPMICSEYMARTVGSTFRDCLPIFYAAGIPAINWGLVSGKTQTIYPWGWNAEKGVPPVPFHDVFAPDGSLLCPDEAEVFDKFRK